MKFWKILALLPVLLGAVEAEAANIAVIAPKEGILAKYGRELAEGAQIAVDVINEAGGISGEKVNLITVDDRCEDSYAVSAAQMMALRSSNEGKIDMVIGPYCTNAFAQVAAIYANGRIIRILPMPLSNGLFYQEAAGLFKIGGMMSDEATAFVEFYKNRMPDKNVAVVYDSSLAETAETAFATQQLFQSNNLNNRITLYDFANYNNEFGQMAKEIILNNQAAYVLSNAEKTAALVQKLQEAKEDIIIFVDEYKSTPYFFNELGNFAEGVYILGLKNLKDSPDFTEELVGLRLKGKEPRGLGVYGYTSVRLWQEMAEKAKSTDFDKINAAAAKEQFSLPWGKTGFVNGNALQSGGYGVGQIKNGEYTQAD